jgi:hypothetical protein
MSALADKKAESERLFVVHAEIERTLDELKCSVAQFLQRYAAEVGQRQHELNKLNQMIAAKHMAGGVSAAREDEPNWNGEARVEADSNAAATIQNCVGESAQTTAEAKRVYRRIASIIHPDKAKDERSRLFRTKLMTELNAAYERKDVTRMKQLLDEWHESPEAVSGEGHAAELKRLDRVIAQLKKRISAIEQEIQRIRSSDVYRLMVQVQEDDRTGRDDLKQMQADLNQKIRDAQNRLIVKMYG